MLMRCDGTQKQSEGFAGSKPRRFIRGGMVSDEFRGVSSEEPFPWVGNSILGPGFFSPRYGTLTVDGDEDRDESDVVLLQVE